MEDLETQESLLEHQTARIHIDLVKSKQQMHAALLAAKEDPDKVFNLISTLMGKMKESRGRDSDIVIRTDALLNEKVFPFATNRIMRRIASEILGYDEATTNRILDPENSLDNLDDKKKHYLLMQYYNKIGLPSTLHSESGQTVMTHMADLEGTKKIIGMQYAHEQTDEYMKGLESTIFTKTDTSFNVEGYTDDWFDARKDSVKKYMESTGISEVSEMIVKGKRTKAVFVVPLSFGNKKLYEKSTLIQTLTNATLSYPFTIERRQIGGANSADVIFFTPKGGEPLILCSPLSGHPISTLGMGPINSIGLELFNNTFGLDFMGSQTGPANPSMYLSLNE